MVFIPESTNIHAFGIYAIVNLCDGVGTTYVGSTRKSFMKRANEHIAALKRGIHRNRHLQGAWNKYGFGAFCFHVLEVVADSDSIIDREQFWLDRFRESGPVYNFGEVARNAMIGRKASEETRQKQSEAAKRRQPLSKEARQRQADALRGRPRPIEVRKKISESSKGKKLSLDCRRKLSEAHKGQTLSELGRLKSSEYNSRPYPAFVHCDTGVIIPAGCNLEALCRNMGLSRSHMGAVKNGKCKSCKGWVLLNEH